MFLESLTSSCINLFVSLKYACKKQAFIFMFSILTLLIICKHAQTGTHMLKTQGQKPTK